MQSTSKNYNSNTQKWVILAIYLIYLFILTLSPYEFSTFWFRKLASYRLDKLIIYLLHFNALDHVNNIFLFIPFGLILRVYFSDTRETKRHGKWKTPILSGMMLSLLVELAQLFLTRSTTLNDVAMNVTGTIIGFRLLDVSHFSNFLGFEKKYSRRLSFLLGVMVSVIFIGLSILPLHLNKLDGWNEDFPLLIGNELTLDRPWEGEIFHVSIYDKALTHDLVQRLHLLGIDDVIPSVRKNMGAVALISFSEGKGDSISESLNALKLNGKNVHWIKDRNGIRLVEGQVLQSVGTARKITERLKRTHQFSIEVWVRTENLKQGGPARIVSLSGGTDRRNFTLGQQGQKIHLRVRTPLTGSNGSDVNLRAKYVITSKNPYHLVATFNRGFERLYVNGKPHQDMILTHLDFCPDLILLGQNTVSKMAFCFLFAFPMGFLFSYSIRKKRFFRTVLTCLSVFIVIESLFLLIVQQPIGSFLVIFSTLFTVLGILAKSLIR